MIVGRPDNKIGNASYPIGKVSIVLATAIRKIRYYYQMILGTNQ